MIRLSTGVALAFCLCSSAQATAAMYVIENPASKISNPADRMSNPATQTNNPAANIYNPGDRMDNPNPLSPPVKPAPATTATATPAAATPARTPLVQQQRRTAELPRKKYLYKTVAGYLAAAKKSFSDDDYREFLSITEAALRRIDAGTLKASTKTRLKLQKYRTFGYGLLE
jgi:hypothetical protein